MNSPATAPPDWTQSSWCHTDAIQLAFGGSLSQFDQCGHERAIAFFSKRLTKTEENFSANNRELFQLVYFLQRFRCFLDGSKFEVLTDNKVLKRFFTKSNLSRREVRWLEFLEIFGISLLSLVKGKAHVLRDAPSRALQKISKNPEISNLSIHKFYLGLPASFVPTYQTNQLFGPLYWALRGNLPDDKVQK